MFESLIDLISEFDAKYDIKGGPTLGPTQFFDKVLDLLQCRAVNVHGPAGKNKRIDDKKDCKY